MKLYLFILLLGCAASVWAKPVDVDATYFHPAASLYVQGDSTSSSNLVVKGLSLFPEDGKLLRLKELLDQQNEEDKDQQQQDQDQQEDQEQDDQEQEQDQQEEQDDQQQQEDEQNQDQQDQQDQPQEPEPPRAEQMSQDEAERLLDAMKQEEETKRLQLHPVMGAPVKVDKDW